MKQPVSESWNDASNEFPLPFALVPWGQHIEIITRSESLEEALFYMQHVMKAPDDNPTIGLLICSDMDKTDVQWSFQGTSCCSIMVSTCCHTLVQEAASPEP